MREFAYTKRDNSKGEKEAFETGFQVRAQAGERS